MSRPKIKISNDEWKIIENLCAIMCTGEEIASVLNVSYDTLERRVREKYKTSFAEYIKKHSAKGRTSLRRMQYRTAESGNATMQIWLGKQYLGQSDKVESDITTAGAPVTAPVIKYYTIEEIEGE